MLQTILVRHAQYHRVKLPPSPKTVKTAQRSCVTLMQGLIDVRQQSLMYQPLSFIDFCSSGVRRVTFALSSVCPIAG
ncbi:hypothetical protein KCP78_19380 [Salmonella enterica subsp. enterica]|nr:hypothetical protein KCP78_19380 [Salmonella enterica subsp. enterica]